jgi:hypothetical protein
MNSRRARNGCLFTLLRAMGIKILLSLSGQLL